MVRTPLGSGSLKAIEILKLQRTIGNQAVSRLLGGRPSSGAGDPSTGIPTPAHDQSSAVIRRKRHIDAIEDEQLQEYLEGRDKKEVNRP